MISKEKAEEAMDVLEPIVGDMLEKEKMYES